MKRLTILGIIACVGLIFFPAIVIAEKPKPVNIVNPLEPYFANGSAFSSVGQFEVFFSIPEGKVLVIEKIFFVLEFETAALKEAWLNSSAGIMHIGPPVLAGTGGTAPDSTLAFVDGPYYASYCGGCKVTGDFSLFANFESSTDREVYMSVSGYLRPMNP